MDSEWFFEQFYASHYVPLALFREGKQEQMISSLDKHLDVYREAALAVGPFVQAQGESMRIFTLEDRGQYGLLRVEGDRQVALLGPVFSHPVTEKQVSAFARHNAISNRDWSLLYWFLAGIPRYSYIQFSNLMAFLHYALHGKAPARQPLEKLGETGEREAALARQAMRSLAEEQRHETYRVENMILAQVRAGDVEGLQRLLSTLGRVGNLREGKVADTPLRQAKNILLGLVALVGKTAAIPGGMDDEEAYDLIDLYSQECERAATIDAVKNLQYNMLLDFAQRVARERLPAHLSPEIAQCVRFLRAHPNGEVGIDEAAGFVGKSRAWLTRRFKEEMGQSLGEYLSYLRIQEAKRLLEYSDLSLKEIASTLGFSSQAYFQSFFKKSVGITPAKFRQGDI